VSFPPFRFGCAAQSGRSRVCGSGCRALVFGHRAANGRRVEARVARMEYRFLAVESGFYEME